jgi:hypothetical protein
MAGSKASSQPLKVKWLVARAERSGRTHSSLPSRTPHCPQGPRAPRRDAVPATPRARSLSRPTVFCPKSRRRGARKRRVRSAAGARGHAPYRRRGIGAEAGVVEPVQAPAQPSSWIPGRSQVSSSRRHRCPDRRCHRSGAGRPRLIGHDQRLVAVGVGEPLLPWWCVALCAMTLGGTRDSTAVHPVRLHHLHPN